MVKNETKKWYDTHILETSMTDMTTLLNDNINEIKEKCV